MKVLALSSSPRRNGNSFLLVESAVKGLQESGHETHLVYLEDHLKGFLRDCRQCRNEKGQCTIDDGFQRLFLDHFLPADGVILGTPLYWYGMSGQLKTFLDRMFCYIAASCPDSDKIAPRMMNKRLALILSAEETYPTAPLGVLHQFQEYARYTRSPIAGVVQGTGNKRGDVQRDPSEPMTQAFLLGKKFFEQTATDYQLDTPRSASTFET